MPKKIDSDISLKRKRIERRLSLVGALVKTGRPARIARRIAAVKPVGAVHAPRDATLPKPGFKRRRVIHILPKASVSRKLRFRPAGDMRRKMPTWMFEPIWRQRVLASYSAIFEQTVPGFDTPGYLQQAARFVNLMLRHQIIDRGEASFREGASPDEDLMLEDAFQSWKQRVEGSNEFKRHRDRLFALVGKRFQSWYTENRDVLQRATFTQPFELLYFTRPNVGLLLKTLKRAFRDTMPKGYADLDAEQRNAALNVRALARMGRINQAVIVMEGRSGNVLGLQTYYFPYAQPVIAEEMKNWEEAIDTSIGVLCRDENGKAFYRLLCKLMRYEASLMGDVMKEKERCNFLFPAWVTPKARGAGLGGSLFRVVWGAAVGSRIKRLALVVADKEPYFAQTLYARMGFKIPEPVYEDELLPLRYKLEKGMEPAKPTYDRFAMPRGIFFTEVSMSCETPSVYVWGQLCHPDPSGLDKIPVPGLFTQLVDIELARERVKTALRERYRKVSKLKKRFEPTPVTPVRLYRDLIKLDRMITEVEQGIRERVGLPGDGEHAATTLHRKSELKKKKAVAQ